MGASGLNRLTSEAALAATAPGIDPVPAAMGLVPVCSGAGEVGSASAESGAVGVAGDVTELEVAGGAVVGGAGIEEVDGFAVTGVVGALDTADADEAATAGAGSDGVGVAVSVAGGVTELEVAGGAVACGAGIEDVDGDAVTGVVGTLDTVGADEAAAAGAGCTAPRGVGVGVAVAVAVTGGAVIDGAGGVAELEEVGGAAACGAGVEDSDGVTAPGVDDDDGVVVVGAPDAGGAEFDPDDGSDPNLARSMAWTTSPTTRSLANGRFHQ